MDQDFSHHDQERKSLANLYCETIDKYEEHVSMMYCDPRNVFTILFYLIKHVVNKNITMLSALKNLLFCIKRQSVFINGLYIEELKDYHSTIQNLIEGRR